MDGLNNEERINAWLASWHPSFDGKAIVNPDFTFRAVNQQFCKILGVSPAELVGQKFSDLTPPKMRELEVKNAELVKKGLIQSFLLSKAYEFQTGKKVDVTLLVNGVYHPTTKKFMFFVSTIMERKVMKSTVAQSQLPTGLLDWIDKKKVGMAALTGMAALLAMLLERCAK